jgi:hypothetical protein
MARKPKPNPYRAVGTAENLELYRLACLEQHDLLHKDLHVGMFCASHPDMQALNR